MPRITKADVQRLASTYMKRASETPGWFADQIDAANELLHDAVDVADRPGGLSDTYGVVSTVVTKIRREVSRDLDQLAKAVRATRMAAEGDPPKPPTARDIKALLSKNGIKGEVRGAGASWEVEVPNDREKNKLLKLMPLGGYKTGYGAWVLQPNFKSKGDWNDPGSGWHYGSDKTAGNIFGYDNPSDIEFLFDPFTQVAQVGMGGEWWTGVIKMGRNVLNHRKERVDPAYKPVTILVEQVGHHMRFAVMGGFVGKGATFLLGFRGM